MTAPEILTHTDESSLTSAPPAPQQKYLLLSAHDYRSPRKAGIHFVASELAKMGPTRFFSLRYSFLSRYKHDPRLSLDDQANKIVNHQGVDCYLWKTLIHPIRIRPFESLMYHLYSFGFNAVLRRWIKESDVIILESGVAPIFFDLIKKLNPRAKILYRASDALDTIDAADYIRNTFARIAKEIDTIVMPSKALADSMPSTHNLAFVPQGIDHSVNEKANPSPYGEGIHAVSVGSMLFDPQFFILAGKRFPHIHFHIIGSCQPRHPEYGENISVYGEMPFDKTLPYIKHATLGIAPYASVNLPAYLRDTSLKLTQYEFFGLPAICPHFIAADYPTRFGYDIGDENSIAQAISRALNPAQPLTKRTVLDWAQVTERMLAPKKFSDTEVFA
ncbi:GumK N-terminal domain-containing glycosyltransferase [Cellvibrio sp. QJXJ]|uniref:GumK N-terminal domain-containing glycosyltransferase n=1 Tax=Cellvibrio sp. QJXJ TaxID=2964606 RepID=UPI0021C27442|nr:glycosyltransferase family 1 protein [Cellvibrio sp. QJXJ]UUA72730.1 glycosyltransferase family 1 protein [Cellvibrio sp. QJXJ]